MKNYTITQEQIKELKSNPEKITEMFPEVFEPKSGWYRHETYPKYLLYSDFEKQSFYGFNLYGNWIHGTQDELNLSSSEYPATESEVREALIKEADIRKLTPYNLSNIKCLRKYDGAKEQKIYPHLGSYYLERHNTQLWIRNGSYLDVLIFKDGIWSEIIEPVKEMTKSEIEKELGYKIKIV